MNESTYTIYFFDMQTKEYINTSRTLPKTGNAIEVPPDGTLVPPPTNIRSDMTAIWDIQGQEWQLVMDYRNIDVYDKKTKERVYLKLGEVPDHDTTTQIAPTDPREEWDEDTGSWLLPISALKEVKKEEIKQAYLTAIDEPYDTNVIGTCIKEGTTDEVEETSVVLKTNMVSRDHIELLLEDPLGEREGDKEEKNMVVVRDHYDRYIHLTRADVENIAKAQRVKARYLLYRKWMLQEKIDNAQSREEIESTSWDSKFDDLDTHGK